MFPKNINTFFNFIKKMMYGKKTHESLHTYGEYKINELNLS